MNKPLEEDVTDVFEGEQPEDTRIRRIKQCESVFESAIVSFEESQQDVLKVKVIEQPCTKCQDPNRKTHDPQECESCGGKGMDEYLPCKYKRCDECRGAGRIVRGPVCSDCGGRGSITLTITTRTTQAGNPKFLMVAKTAIESIARLEGLYLPSSQVRIEGDV